MDTPAPAAPPSTLTSVGTMLATKGLAVLATFLVTHGLMTGSSTEAFIALAPALVSLGWSGYREYLHPIFLAQMEVLKAKSLAQAAALKAANVPKVTVSQIAAQSPTMGPAEVAKVIATLPPEIKETVALPLPGGQPAQAPPMAGLPKTTGLAIVLAFAAALGLGWPEPAHAQINRQPAGRAAPVEAAATESRTTTHGLPCDLLNLLPGCQIQSQDATGKTTTKAVELDLWKKITDAALPDLDYASQLAAAAGTGASGVRKQCWDAIITANKQASGLGVKNADGTARAKPDPSLFTDVESLAEVLDNLAPGGPLWTACAGAAQLAKTNVLTLLNAMVTGAAGMAALGVT